MKGNGDAGSDPVEHDKKGPFDQDSRAHGSYSALLDLHSETVDREVVMNGLLKFATEAHGGLDRWNQFSSLTASVSVTGALWQIKGKPDILKDVRIELTLHLERLVTHIAGQNKRFFFTRSRVAIEDEQGKTLDSRNDPRTAFDGQLFETPWDELQIAYFNSYALWTYLTIPFLYAHPAFITEELPPWHEDGEEWHPLRTIFPSTIASHCQEQISYVGPDGLLRRHEYVVDVMGGARVDRPAPRTGSRRRAVSCRPPRGECHGIPL